jgi:hypothetical protein
MTRSITPITAAGKDGDTDKRASEKGHPEHGLAALRGKEGRGLISLACDALHGPPTWPTRCTPSCTPRTRPMAGNSSS